MRQLKRYLGKLAWPAVALALLVNAGCLLAVAGAGAAAAGTAGYLYYNGLLYREYPANLADTTATVRASLNELQLPLDKETNDTGSVTIESKTAKGDKVSIYLDLVGSALPVDAVATRVSIRVGFTGDDAVSKRILDQVSSHFTRNVPVPQSPPGPPAAPAPVVVETAAPPLAPVPVPVKR